MFVHASLDSNNTCIGYSDLAGVEDASNIVYLPNGWDEDLKWRKFENGAWSTEKYTVPATDPLDLAKQLKLNELKEIETANLGTFKSSALGTEYTYLSGLTDMLLLTGQYAFVKGDDYDNADILWYTVEGGNVSHTAAQFVQMYLDARSNVATVKYHRATLEYQVGAATTIEVVQAIVW